MYDGAVSRCLAALLVFALSSVLLGCAQTQLVPCTPQVYALRADSTIELTVNGQAGHFLLDTGANVSALEPDWARAVTTLDGAQAILPALRLGGETIGRAAFKVEPLAASYIGTLGTDILRRFIITFDYRAGHVEISPARQARSCTPDRARHVPVPFALLHAVPYIALRVGDKTIRALIDTGAWYEFVGVKRTLIEQLADRLNFVKNVYIVSTHGRKLQPSFMGLPIHIGPVELHAPIVQDDANIIGLHVLRRFGRFTIDFANNALWVDRAQG